MNGKGLTPLESGMPINAITMDLTNRCNLACEYCFAGCQDQSRARKDLDMKTAIRIIDWLFDPSTCGGSKEISISFWGGEPLLKFDLMKQIIEYAEEAAEHRGVTVKFGGTTNVTLLTEEKFEYLDQHKCYFLLSVDGIKKHHDRYRKFPDGSGSWDLIDKRIDKIIERWPFIKVRMSYTAEFIDEFFEDVLYLHSKGFKDIAFSPVSEGDWTDEKLRKLTKQMEKIHAWYLKRHLAGDDITLKSVSDANNCISRPMGDNAPCGAGRQYVGISTEGAIYPCVPPGTRVKQANGVFTPIELLRVGDYVYTHNNRSRQVTKLYRRKYEGYLYEIHPFASRKKPLQFTPEHPVFTTKGWKDAKDLKRNDRLLVGYNNENYETPDINQDTLKAISILAAYVRSIKILKLDKMLVVNSFNDSQIVWITSYITKMWPNQTVQVYKDGNDLVINSHMFVSLFMAHFRNTFISQTILHSNKRNKACLVDNLEKSCEGVFGLCRINTGGIEYADLIRSLLLQHGIYPFITDSHDILFFKRGTLIAKKLAKLIIPQYQIVPIASIKRLWYNNDVHNIEVYEDNSYTLDGLVCHNCHRFNKLNDNRSWEEKETCLGHIDNGITNQEFRDRFINWSPDTSLPESCKKCHAYKISCTGGCWATNHDLGGDISTPTMPNCLIARNTADTAEQLYRFNSLNQRYQAPGCICYNACYLEGTPFEMQIINRRDPESCRCNHAEYHKVLDRQIVEKEEDLRELLGIKESILDSLNKINGDNYEEGRC